MTEFDISDASKESMDQIQTKKSFLLREALFWIGSRESGGDNQGETIKLFQGAVTRPQGQSWCMDFVQFCVKRIDDLCDTAFPTWEPSTIFRSESCALVWAKSPTALRVDGPAPGCIVIWQHGQTGLGHCGIIETVLPDGTFQTIEGNTSDSEEINREGDGVYQKIRNPKGDGNLQIVGFLSPWV
jgi:hypothetical protein